MKFDKKYTDYWQSAINKSIDGLRIPGLPEAHKLLPYLKIEEGDQVLDMGCSYGRMYKELSQYSENIFGVDLDPYAVEKAKEQGYIEVLVGKAEDTGYQKKFFDRVFCWQVFDVVDQLEGFKEINRILKVGGSFLVTGKNYDYDPNDIFAFKAEKNAFLKGFPNRFTKIDWLMKNLSNFGFQTEKLLLFAKRGDFGLLNFKEADKTLTEYTGYEYLLICNKVSEVSEINYLSNDLETVFSLPAQNMTKDKGFSHTANFFKSIGID